jgi:hypothetical protein
LHRVSIQITLDIAGKTLGQHRRAMLEIPA